MIDKKKSLHPCLKKLKKKIESSGIKKKKVAEEIGCSVVHLSYVLNGKRNLSKALECSINDYLKDK